MYLEKLKKKQAPMYIIIFDFRFWVKLITCGCHYNVLFKKTSILSKIFKCHDTRVLFPIDQPVLVL